MSAIAKALDDIKRTIPEDILKIAFNDNLKDWRRAPVSLDQKILDGVIRPRVMIDANILSSEEVIVPLNNLAGDYLDDFTIMYVIPPHLLNNRDIISVKSIGYLPYAVSFSSFGAGVGTVGPSGITDLTGAGQRLGDASSNIPPVSEANVDLIGHNTVVIRNFRRITAAYHLRCIVSNDANMNNINPRSWHAFAAMCILAVKSHIYNTLIIKLDKAYLTGGQELGSIRSYVENLQDTEEQYQTFLREKWMKIAKMNNTQAYQRQIKSMINPGI